MDPTYPEWWYSSYDTFRSFWEFVCDEIRSVRRCQATDTRDPADTESDVLAPKEKPRPPRWAVYKSLSKPG